MKSKYFKNIISQLKIKRHISFICLLIIFISSCKKIVEVEAPYTSTSAGNVFKEDNNAIAVVTAIFAQASSSAVFSGSRSINLFAGLSSDELTLNSGVTQSNYVAYYINDLVANQISSFGSENWQELYNYIYQCNAAIEGLQVSTTLTAAVKQQLLGEAKFLRAFFYFYLVNLYGDVPLALTTDYKVNALLSRTFVSDVYRQIILDLNEAKDLLSADYLDGRLVKYSSNLLGERVRPTKWASLALLSRVYLYAGNWAGADSSASVLISNTSIYDTVSLNNVFLKNSKEAIWQLQPVNSGRNTEDATTFILTTSGPTSNTDRPVYLSDTLLKSFEVGDQRKTQWVNNVVATGTGINYYYPFKYKNNGSTVTEYLMALRLGEQYLVRAEARVHLGNISGAKNDLNVIRARARLNPTTANDQTSLLSAILHERQVELFTEWANRWFDLKRTQNVDAIMTVITPKKSNGLIQWRSYQQLYPILFSDLAKNHNLIQNSGY